MSRAFPSSWSHAQLYVVGVNTTSPQRAGTRPRRQQNDMARDRSDRDTSDIPQYYFEWAATIAALPGHEQANTLAAMPDEDASNIQRILRSKARRRSAELTEDAMVSAAKQRSMRCSPLFSAGLLQLQQDTVVHEICVCARTGEGGSY